MESRVRGNAHSRFGGRAEETGRAKSQYRASARPYCECRYLGIFCGRLSGLVACAPRDAQLQYSPTERRSTKTRQRCRRKPANILGRTSSITTSCRSRSPTVNR